MLPSSVSPYSSSAAKIRTLLLRAFGCLDHFGFLLDLEIPHRVSLLSTVVTCCSWLVVLYLKFETMSFFLWTVSAVMAIFTALTTNPFVLLGIGCHTCFVSDGVISVICKSFANSVISPTQLVLNISNCQFVQIIFISINVLSIHPKTISYSSVRLFKTWIMKSSSDIFVEILILSFSLVDS